MRKKTRLLLPLLFLLVSPPAPAALVDGNFIPCMTASPSGSIYTVQPGDTLYAIARRNGLSCQALLALNPDLSAEHLPIGAGVALPASARRTAPAAVSRGSSPRFYAWPLTGIITSPFGRRGTGIHHGIDIAGSTGDPVRASAAGIVSKAACHEIYGNFILLDHANGQQTLYAHLNRMDVRPGEAVSRGQIIGAVGSTGNSTGPHLHFEIRENQIAADPLPYLPR